MEDVGMRTLTAVLAGLMISTSPLPAQPRSGGDQEGMAPFLFTEPVNLIAADSSLSRLDVHYRIDRGFFVAVKSRDSSSSWAFICRGDILVEVFDSLDVSRSRTIHHVELGVNQPTHDQTEKTWYSGIASFDLAPGPYRIVLEIDDLESERRYVDNRTTIRLKRFSVTSQETTTPLFVQWDRGITSSQSLIPVGFGPHLLFGKEAALFLEIPSAVAADKIQVMYSIATSSTPDRTAKSVEEDTLKTPLLLPRVRLEASTPDGEPSYTISSSDSSRALGILVPLASEKLPLRRFDLDVTVKAGNAELKAKKTFQMVWPDMPMSLRDIDNAINALKYITTEEQRDSLRKGSLEGRRDNLEAFWKRKDPAPETAFNEVMVEYYRRVDHATRTFGTLRDPDGFKTDRGKIYILYGPPTSMERTLSPSSGYQEEWTYEAAGKRFIFADQTKNGNYVLVSTQSL
jgi:GWxTD domain-containing protein